ETSRRLFLIYKGFPEIKEGKSTGNKDKSELENPNERYFHVNCKNYDGSIDYDIEKSQFYYKLREDSVYKEIPTEGNECTWDVSDIESDQYHIKSEFKWSYITETGQKYEKEQKDSILYDHRRPITIGTISTVFKDPRNKPDTKNVYGHIDPLDEIDTLKVTVPIAINPEKWGHVEILKDGKPVPEKIYKPLSEPWYKDSADGLTRTYKFVWNFYDDEEGFVTLRARYKLDTLSWSQKKTKVEYAETWENFDNAEGGALPPGWETKTQYAYPPGNGPEQHYWRTKDNTNIYDVAGMENSSFTSNDLRTSTSAFSSQRFEILSPVIEIPDSKDSVATFLYFDYARELVGTGGRTLMVMQFCDESGNMLPYEFQPIGSLNADEVLEGGSHYPLTGYPLNLQNFFSENPYGPSLYPDNLWLNMKFGLSPPFTNLPLEGERRKIRVKFIQYYNNDFVGIIDNWDYNSGTPIWNPESFTSNPPTYTGLTFHHFDNFCVKTYYDINLPPTIKAVADQEVIQHCGWQSIELTGISNGQGTILGDYEEIGTDGKGILKDIVKINSVEETENGTLKITALVRDDKDLKEISFDPNALKASKFPTQQVIEMKITSSNEELLPKDSLRYEFTPGADKVDLYYKPVDTENGETELRVWLKDDGGIEHNGRDTTEIKFKVNVIPFNAPKYDPPITELTGITEDFPEMNINLGDHFKDAEDDPITYSISADTSLVDITLTGGDGKSSAVLNIKSKKNVFGTGLLTIMADDKSGAIPTIVTININIVDDGNDFEFEDQYVIINEDDLPVKNLPVNFEPESMDLTAMFNSESANAAVFSLSLDNNKTLNAALSGSNINLTAIQDSMGVAIASIGVTINGMQYNTKLKFVVGNFPPEIKAEIPDIETPANLGLCT
ncbi:MAG: hypothetical protein L6407_00400, partial [Candidatus Delongbacteria bacterium]|nr:hypothetical protein [Candidatus Delongbacteria bacterium]